VVVSTGLDLRGERKDLRAFRLKIGQYALAVPARLNENRWAPVPRGLRPPWNECCISREENATK